MSAQSLQTLGIAVVPSGPGRVTGSFTMPTSGLRDPIGDRPVKELKIEAQNGKVRVVHPPGLRFMPHISLAGIDTPQMLAQSFENAHNVYQKNVRQFRTRLEILGLKCQVSGSGEYVVPLELFERGTVYLRIENDGVWVRQFLPLHRAPQPIAHRLNLDVIEDSADLNIAVDSAIRQATQSNPVEESIPLATAPTPAQKPQIALVDVLSAFDERAKISNLCIQSVVQQGARVLGVTVVVDEKGVQGSVFEQGKQISSEAYDHKRPFADWVKQLLPKGVGSQVATLPAELPSETIVPGTQWTFGVHPDDANAETVHYRFLERTKRPCGTSLSLPKQTFHTLFVNRADGFHGHVRVTGERANEVLYVHLNSHGRMMTNPIAIDRGIFALCFNRAL